MKIGKDSGGDTKLRRMLLFYQTMGGRKEAMTDCWNDEEEWVREIRRQNKRNMVHGRCDKDGDRTTKDWMTNEKRRFIGKMYMYKSPRLCSYMVKIIETIKSNKVNTITIKRTILDFIIISCKTVEQMISLDKKDSNRKIKFSK